MELRIIATLEYREKSNPDLNIKESCNLLFLGMDDNFVDNLMKQWMSIYNERSEGCNANIKKLVAGKDLVLQELTEAQEKYKASKKWYRKENDAEKSLLAEIEKHKREIEIIDLSIEKLESIKIAPAAELKEKAYELLRNNGFVRIGNRCTDDEYPMHTEVWHYIINTN